MTIDAAISAFGENLRVLRTERKLSQEDLATQMKTTKSQIARLESGKANPTLQTLLKIREILGVEIPALVPNQMDIEHTEYNEDDFLTYFRSKSELSKRKLMTIAKLV